MNVLLIMEPLTLHTPNRMAKKLALAMIVKNEEKHIESCINSVRGYVDEFRILDTGSTDKTLKVLRRLGKKLPNFHVSQITPQSHPDYYVEVSGRTRIKFAKARNLSFEGVESDWILWLDGDDEMRHPERMAGLIASAESRGVNIISCTYNYLINDGKVETSHPKERIVKKGTVTWERDPENWIVHENLYSVGDDFGEFAPEIWVDHVKEKDEIQKSGERNIDLLTYMLGKIPKDPRVHFLLGRELFGVGRFREALKHLTDYLDMEYTPHDALVACYNLCLISEINVDFKYALEYALQAIKVKPDHPLGYVLVAKYNLLLGNHEACLSFLEDATRRTTSPLDPIAQINPTIMRLSAMLASESYERLGRYEESIAAMKNWYPYASDAEKKELDKEIKEVFTKAQIKKVREAFVVMSNVELARQKEAGKLDVKVFEGMIDRLPDGVRDSNEVCNLKRVVGLTRKLKNTITFYCVMNFEKWDPETVVQNGGGGSETSVVEMASRFAKAGYNVEVYANPPVEKVFKGVSYKNVRDINFADDFDIFINWRNVHLFKELDIHARKKYLWLQDIMFPEDYTKDLVDKVDKIIVLSGYHRSTALHVPESKFFYTTNGINVGLIEEIEKEGLERENGKCLYCSSSDRGLEGLVKMWPEVKKAAPHANLTWYYGWNSWAKMRNDEEALKWKDKMIKDMAKAGIVEGGRIGKRELYREMFKGQFLTYPLVGPAETSCIVVMEAQACGLLPVTTGITALEETQQFGVKVPLNQYQETLIKLLNADTEASKEKIEKVRQQMMKWARETFNWDKVAEDWIKNLF